MSKKLGVSKNKVPTTPLESHPSGFRHLWLTLSLVIVAIAYSVPLVTQDASIQWDAVDVHYSAQRYFAERILRGELPHWTPYVFAGFPFLADPQTGAWYPGNWPFLLAGAGPKALQAELAFHAMLAAAGVFLLLRRLLTEPAAAAGAICYALGGFFAGHSSHLGIFESAALFPWLSLALFQSVEGRFWRGAFLGTAVGGSLILAGHFQTALYSFSGIALLAAAVAIRERGAAIRNAFAFLGIVATGSFLLSAIQVLPGLELTAESIRSSLDTSARAEGVLEPRALLTLLFPDALGSTSGTYNGPGDVTQNYFYAGFLLLPLAALGARNAKARFYALWLAVPALLYMAGPALGFFRLISWLPGFRQVRAPVHAWFLAAIALAILVAAGVDWASSRWRWAGSIAVAILAFDLCVNNVWTNPLAYAHESFEKLYGSRLDLARRVIVPVVPPGTRFEAPDQLGALGPMNHPLDLRMETTYGYNPLQLVHYSEFRDAFARNPKLRDSLSVSRVLDAKIGAVAENPTRLPWAYFPKDLILASNGLETRRALDTLDPPRQTVLLTKSPPVPHQDPAATATLEASTEQSYRIRYKAASAGVVRLSLPYFPGWVATVDGATCPIFRADHALTAVVVPPGEKLLTLQFHSTRFRAGTALSGLGLLLLAGLGVMGWRRDGQAQ